MKGHWKLTMKSKANLILNLLAHIPLKLFFRSNQGLQT